MNLKNCVAVEFNTLEIFNKHETFGTAAWVLRNWMYQIKKRI